MSHIKLLPKQSAKDRQQLADTGLSDWWNVESGDWDELVTGKPARADSTSDLYDDMPVVDSKAVSRASPILEKIFGVRFDSSMIRPGGYPSIAEASADLGTKMEEKLQRNLERERSMAK